MKGPTLRLKITKPIVGNIRLYRVMRPQLELGSTAGSAWEASAANRRPLRPRLPRLTNAIAAPLRDSWIRPNGFHRLRAARSAARSPAGSPESRQGLRRGDEPLQARDHLEAEKGAACPRASWPARCSTIHHPPSRLTILRNRAISRGGGKFRRLFKRSCRASLLSTKTLGAKIWGRPKMFGSAFPRKTARVRFPPNSGVLLMTNANLKVARERITVELEPALRAQIERIAEQQDRSLSAQVRRFLASAIENQGEGVAA
jgi:hypothetical protein